MKDLIEALTILLAYYNDKSYQSAFPTHCEHDVLHVFTDNPVSARDVDRLEALGFSPSREHGADPQTSFRSYTFGSC